MLGRLSELAGGSEFSPVIGSSDYKCPPQGLEVVGSRH